MAELTTRARARSTNGRISILLGETCGDYSLNRRCPRVQKIPSSLGCILTPGREARSNPGRLPNRRTGNGKCHRKITPGLRTGEDEPAATYSELERGGSGGGRDGAGNQSRGQAARSPLRQ